MNASAGCFMRDRTLHRIRRRSCSNSNNTPRAWEPLQPPRLRTSVSQSGLRQATFLSSTTPLHAAASNPVRMCLTSKSTILRTPSMGMLRLRRLRPVCFVRLTVHLRQSLLLERA
jgi:hypothetical protein